MRPGLDLLIATAVLAAAPSGAAARTSPAHARFEASIGRTKQAMMGDPKAALASARHAVALARRLPPSPRNAVDLATAEWLEGEALIFLNELAAATPIIDGALANVERSAPNIKLHGDLLRAHGAIMAARGKVTEALRDYQRAHDVFERAGEARSRALSLQDIGLIYADAGDYDRALHYYGQSAEVFSGDPTLTLTMQNNRAEVLRKQKRYDQAAAAYRAALVQARKLGSPLLQTRIFTNIAGSEAEAGRLAAAQAAVGQAMALSAHGEAAGWRPFVFGAAARVAAGRGDNVRAAQYLGHTFKGVDLAESDLSYREYHWAAAEVFEELGDVAAALAHAKAFQRLESEAVSLTASAASQLMAARFDFTNQNLKISKLKQDQLARDVRAERERSEFRSRLFTGLFVAGAFVFGMLLFGFFAVRRSRDAVRAVNVRLEKALKAKTEFLATTSHEVRTPLNGILGMTQVLLADRTLEPGVRERIEVVHGAGETMKALVDDILDVAKMESGELTVAREPCDFRAILDDAARLWSGQAQTKGLELVLEADGAPARIMSDGARLRQIVFNLMSNALKFTADGRVTLSAAAEAGGTGERLVVRVVDTGIGIPPEAQAEIFEAFKQVDGGVTRRFGGTGLGLAICKQLVEKLGGGIAVESAVGRGTTFTVTLPLERAAAAEAAADADGRDDGLAGVRMLLVDRNPLNQSILRVLLAAESAEVAVVDGVAPALEAIAGGGIDHVLLDAATAAAAEGDRLAPLRDVARAAREAGAHCSLLLSPAAADLSVAEGMAAGASQLVVKPITGPELVAALRSLHGDEPETLVAPSLLQAA